ncbi:MAG: hypothetical protein IJ034_00185, partial [Mailhella sp.]|nr:hypothetical protein [Mailhella sp.]
MAVDARKLLARYRMLREERQSWDGAWRELAELFLPTRWQAEDETSYGTGGSSGGYGTDAPYLNDRLVNSAGVLAMRTMAAGLQGGMTSPVRPWFRLKLREGGVVESLSENVLAGAGVSGGAGLPGPSGGAGGPESLNAWLDEATRAMQSVLHSSNAYTALHGLYADLGTFGTALLVETADASGLHFHLVRAGEYVLDVDSKGNVDTFYRRMNMTARQIVDKWGSCGTGPEAVRRAAESATSSTRRYSVIHAVFPREDW